MNDLTQAQLEAILCRSLTTCESNNLALYLSIAKNQIKTLLCYDPFAVGGVSVKEFVYNQDQPYYILQPFKTLNSVTVNKCGSSDVKSITCDWIPVDKHGDVTANATCFMALKRCKCNDCDNFTCCDNSSCMTLSIDADWGCDSPDIQLLLAKSFAEIAKGSCSNEDIDTKTIRSFTVKYREHKPFTESIAFKSIVANWSACDRTGDVS